MSDVIFLDRVTYSDQDAAGYAVISAGDTTVDIVFENPYTDTPIVTVSPQESFVAVTTSDVSAEGFTISIEDESEEDVLVTWTALAIVDPITSTSNSAVAEDIKEIEKEVDLQKSKVEEDLIVEEKTQGQDIVEIAEGLVGEKSGDLVDEGDISVTDEDVSNEGTEVETVTEEGTPETIEVQSATEEAVEQTNLPNNAS